MTIAQFFQTLTGFPPRQFQREAIAHLLNRQDVILRAPTGSGKTETAIAPFLFAKTLQCDFPNKLIYVVPLRTLANSLRQRAETLARTWETFIEERRGEGETRRRGEFYTDIPASPCPRVPVSHQQPSRPLVVTLQTGENPEDPRFEGDIVFCTIDQMLSSFLNIPYSVGRGSANVNAGAIFASYLVFDELHLLDPDRSFATVLKVLEQVKGISPFLLMTATLTDELATQIKRLIDGS
ncbi:DEAD/DEAH box helicase [Allocoleopsis franciscana]|uniref:DEAD/DEAH box helicase n=1 Tax=Allocoleopsis franciscana TaxID=2886352 RepID=UPI0002E3770E|nr:DEAD/DEAH box helicase [Allocoleopsis franciscana]